MKIILIFCIVAECLILALLTVFKKWTKKIFIIVSAITALSCGVMGIFEAKTNFLSDEIDQRESLYMASRLIQEDYAVNTLEVLSLVRDEKSASYGSRSIRALAYNLNNAHEMVGDYLKDGGENDFEQSVLAFSEKKELADEETIENITGSVLQLIDASETEALRWETKMKVWYMGLTVPEEEISEMNDKLLQVKLALNDNRYEDAYNLLSANHQNEDIKNAVIISNMYIKNYDNRTMVNTDEEYAQLWTEAATLQADLNLAALTLPKDDADVTSPEYRIYEKAQENYNLAMNSLTQESVKRAINYLTAVDVESVNPEYWLGYQLQFARLYFMNNQTDLAEEYIDKVFLSEYPENSQWLRQDILEFKKAYLNFIYDQTNDEYILLFNKMMENLYQNIFDGESYDLFREFVCSYLRDKFGGISIKNISVYDFPKVVAEVSTTKPDIQLNEHTLNIYDTDELIEDFSVDTTQIGNLNITFVLDKSGSMAGNKLIESKSAIRNYISQMPDDIPLSFVSFGDSSVLECALTQSKYLIMNLVDGVYTSGNTNIASGLSTAIDSLKNASGTKVIILLSDGHDSDASSQAMTGVLTEAIANDIIVYTIGLQGCNKAYLQDISNQTNGQFVMVTNTAELNNVYQEIQNSLVKNYVISYTVSGEEEKRDIMINVNDSYTQTSRKYSSVDGINEDKYYSNKNQQSGCYKQIGATNMDEEEVE